MARRMILLGALIIAQSFSVQLFSYPKEPSVSFVIQPSDWGVGIRTDYLVRGSRDPGYGSMGFYGSLSYGSWSLYKQAGLKDHIKVTTGVMLPLRPYRNSLQWITAGVNYHYFSPGSVRDIWISQIIYEHLSFELGHTVRIGRVHISYSLDIRRWEPCFGVGFVF